MVMARKFGGGSLRIQASRLARSGTLWFWRAALRSSALNAINLALDRRTGRRWLERFRGPWAKLNVVRLGPELSAAAFCCNIGEFEEFPPAWLQHAASQLVQDFAAGS